MRLLITVLFLALMASVLVMLGGCVSLPVAPPAEPLKSLFPKQEWTDYVYQKCQSAAFTKRPIADTWYSNTPENCVHLMAAMAKYESSFNPSATYKENFKNSRGEYVISTGLFQVSYESSRGYGFAGITTEQLKDPYKNIDVAIAIMDKWATADGTIDGNGKSPYKGASKYWSCLRVSGKLESVKATYKSMAQ
jgi:hypothetical protein